MKTLRQICAATILSLTLALSVLAGQIECPGAISTGTGTTSATGPTTTIILVIVTVAYS